jgi:hypothetical protein
MSEHADVKMIITCDACKKTITGRPAESQHLFGERLDLCTDCAEKFYICAKCGEIHTITAMLKMHRQEQPA